MQGSHLRNDPKSTFEYHIGGAYTVACQGLTDERQAQGTGRALRECRMHTCCATRNSLARHAPRFTEYTGHFLSRPQQHSDCSWTNLNVTRNGLQFEICLRTFGIYSGERVNPSAEQREGGTGMTSSNDSVICGMNWVN